VTRVRRTRRPYQIVEGVPWYRHVISFRLHGQSGTRRLVRWSPGAPWIYDEVARELVGRFGARVVPGSVDVRLDP